MHEPTSAPGLERPLTADVPSRAEDGAEPTTLDDSSRLLQILATKHWSLLTSRALAYNEAFTRASMFLAFLSMSFVALALLAQATGFTREYLFIAAMVLCFDFLIGTVTYIRTAGANREDLLATQGMNRIRHGYLQIDPRATAYFVSGTNDDVAGVLKSWGFTAQTTAGSGIAYGLSTSQGMVGLILSLLGGLILATVALGFWIFSRGGLGGGCGGDAPRVGFFDPVGAAAGSQVSRRPRCALPHARYLVWRAGAARRDLAAATGILPRVRMLTAASHGVLRRPFP